MIVKKSLPKVLICDDDKTLHLAIKTVLGNNYDLKSAYNGDEAVAILRNQRMDIVLLDMEMRHASEGLETIPRLIEIQNDVEIIFFSGKLDFKYVRDAMKLGAADYIPKDSGPEELKHVFSKTLQSKHLKNKNAQTQFELKKEYENISFIGESPAVQKIKKQIERAKNSPAPLIIFGETGTGKEVVARLLRKNQPDGFLEPFVAVDSSTIQSTLAESVLFGYEKGAFTGADKPTRGLFEEADGGTIYFDELGNMPLEIQNKLLRVIQEKEVMRIGAAKPIDLEFRVICATNEDLESWIKQGKFREDLYQRLNVLQITLPPLRERIEDIPLLLNHFTERLSEGRPRLNFLPEAVKQIQKYPFPGNIRELENLVMYLYTMCDSQDVSPLDLPPKYQTANSAGDVAGGIDSSNFYAAVEAFEKIYLAKQYDRMGANVSKMSQELGMDRSYLHSKLKNYGIHMTKK
ncbi:MAG: sigma-54-dependent Fis family transcriptional regulator [Bdellovibrionales bacterium]|nr:sigma-54-dependent Fis family transcriptional regulator [Bdellovibrionales bacterium]